MFGRIGATDMRGQAERNSVHTYSMASIIKERVPEFQVKALSIIQAYPMSLGGCILC
jgi:hypothetical protein